MPRREISNLKRQIWNLLLVLNHCFLAILFLRPNGCELSGRGSLGQFLFQACAFALSLTSAVELPSARSMALPRTHIATVSCFWRSIPGPIQRGVSPHYGRSSRSVQVLIHDLYSSRDTVLLEDGFSQRACPFTKTTITHGERDRVR